MDDWNTSRHSYTKPRLLGEVKTEYVYLNLCDEHSFLSPRFKSFKPNHALAQNTVKMRELRESLRQAALINIVASVNENTPGNPSLSRENIDVKSNQCGIPDLIRERTSLHFQELRSSLRDSREPDSAHYEKQRLCPKLKLSDALSEHNHKKRELSMLEGRRIEAPYMKENLKPKPRKVNYVKPGCDSDMDLRGQVVSGVRTYYKKTKCPPSTFVPNDNGTMENPVTNSGRASDLQCILHSENVLTSNLDSQRITESPHEGFKSSSSRDSGSANTIDAKHQNSIRDTLHISTKEGGIGRSAGYFPSPRLTTKRDHMNVSPKLLVETRLPKCDAVDILDPISNTDDVKYPMIIKSQRDNLGEMGTCLFGMARTNSRPSGTPKLKRNKRQHKLEKELIVLSAPIARQSRDSSDNLSHGIVGVNISGEGNDESLESIHHTSPIPVDISDSDVTSAMTNISSKNGVPAISIPTDRVDNPTYHLENSRNCIYPNSARPISLEGRGLPAVQINDSQSRTQRFPHNPHSSMLSEVQSREQGPQPQGEGESGSLPHLSKQVYDFRGLSVSSDNSSTIKQIRPIVRKSGLTLNGASLLSYIQRPRPINASMSASKDMEDTKKSFRISAQMLMLAEDLEKRPKGSVDVSICASKVEDPEIFREKTLSTRDDHGIHEDVTEPRRQFLDDGSSSNSEYCKRTDGDFPLYSDSDSDLDITKVEPPKTPVVSRKNTNQSGIAKHQGISSMNTNRDKLTKLHVIKDGGDTGIGETTVKILKSLDQDIYADFTHRKLRNKNFSNNNNNNNNDGEDANVVLVKVRCSTNDPVSAVKTQISNNKDQTVSHNTNDFNESDLSDSDLS